MGFLFIFNKNYSSRVAVVNPAVFKKFAGAKNLGVESCMYDLELNIIKRIKNGDVNAFEQIVEKYKDKALTLSERILKNREDAEDSIQEAFIKAFRAIVDNQFEERSKFSTYFYRIVYNTAIDNYKKLKTRTYSLIRIDDGFGRKDNGDSGISSFEMKIDESRYSGSNVYQTDRKTLEKELQEFVNKYLEQIPEKYAVILTLFYINDLSHEEISETLMLPLGTVKNRIFRAKEKLKEIMLKQFSYESILEFI
jgi:RNA polymerase sigma-70 factor (ECF subfamily)